MVNLGFFLSVLNTFYCYYDKVETQGELPLSEQFDRALSKKLLSLFVPSIPLPEKI